MHEIMAETLKKGKKINVPAINKKSTRKKGFHSGIGTKAKTPKNAWEIKLMADPLFFVPHPNDTVDTIHRI